MAFYGRFIASIFYSAATRRKRKFNSTISSTNYSIQGKFYLRLDYVKLVICLSIFMGVFIRFEFFYRCLARMNKLNP